MNIDPLMVALASRKPRNEFIMACLKNRRILLVDDEPAVRRSTRLFLEQEGYECREAEDAREALSLLDGGLRVDVIVSDYHMPVMNGLDFLKALSYRLSGQNIRVILISGDMTGEMEQQVMEMGAFAVLQKPIDYQYFREILGRAFNASLE